MIFPYLVKKNLHDKGSIYYSSYSAGGDVTSFPLLLCCLALRAETWVITLVYVLYYHTKVLLYIGWK